MPADATLLAIGAFILALFDRVFIVWTARRCIRDGIDFEVRRSRWVQLNLTIRSVRDDRSEARITSNVPALKTAKPTRDTAA